MKLNLKKHYYMNSTQRQQILDLTEKIKSFDLVGFLKSQGVEDLETFQYSDRLFAVFKTQLERMLDQLSAEVESQIYKHLPVTYNSQTEFGNINLNQDLNDLLSSLKVHNNENNVVGFLDKLIFFQIAFGFWDRSSIHLHDPRSIDIKRRINELSALEEKFKNQREKIEKDIVEVTALSTQLKDGLTQIVNNATQISTNKQESDIFLASIKRNLEDTNITKTQVNTLEAIITESLNKVNSDISENSKKFNDIEIQNKTLKDNLMKTVKDALYDQEEIKSTYNYITSQKEQIEKMVGLATDGAIGYKFDERQKSIFKSLWFWRIAVPLSYVFAALWVVILFTLFKAEFDNEWLNLSINLIKTTPAWFLVAFCTNQYKKEREFEEEYAFKSAVAMTITSYTSLLSNDDANNMKTKDQVLSKVLDKLYASPLKNEGVKRRVSIRRNYVTKEANSKAKELEEILNPLIELLKEIKK